MALQPVEKMIVEKIKRCGRGYVFSGTDFVNMGKPTAVRQALSRLSRAGEIRRIATALYFYPAINKKLGGEVPPSADAVAQAIVRRTASRIVASGALAANILGLSTQVPAKRIYLTDGPSRKINVGAYSLHFRHVSPRRMTSRGKISAIVFEAFRYQNKNNVTDEVVDRLRRTLSSKAKAELHRDLCHAPIWMRPLVEKITVREH